MEANLAFTNYLENFKQYYANSSPFGASTVYLFISLIIKEIAESGELSLPAFVKRAMSSYHLGLFGAVHENCRHVLEANYRFMEMANLYKGISHLIKYLRE